MHPAPLPTPTKSQAWRPPVSWARWAPACSGLIVGASLLTAAAAAIDNYDSVVAVYSAVSPAYTRTSLPNGSFKPETYTFGEGGFQRGAMSDFTIDKLSFLDVARLIAPSLAAKNYLPATDPHQTDLLIMVYWGMTNGTTATYSSFLQMAQASMPQGLPPLPAKTGADANRLAEEDAQGGAMAQSLMLIHLADRLRDQQDLENAKMLGYLPELIRRDVYKGTYFNKIMRQDVVDEVEENRYYVVLLAYDFPTIWKNKQRKILWETRFSIRERHNDFSKVLAAMAQNASRYFGRDSQGLIRERLPDTQVIIGEPKVVGYETDQKK